MRGSFVKKLIEAARRDPNLYLLTADLGFRALESFRDEFPKQFVNVGVAEANMVGLAVGLALTGKRVCVYSIVPFVTFRCYEQIRNDVCWHDLDIKLIGVGGGFSYGNQGISHNTTEDVAVMRALPNMTVFSPADRVEAEAMSEIVLNHRGPAYLKLGKTASRQIYSETPKFEFGRGLTVRAGGDLTLISTGNIIETALAAADALAKRGIGARVISMPCVKPLDQELVLKAARETGAVFTVEEHSIIGGLGSAVAETILESEHSGIVFHRFGVPDVFPDRIGSQQYLRDHYGLSVEMIVTTVLEKLKSK
jgi:transketolase